MKKYAFVSEANWAAITLVALSLMLTGSVSCASARSGYRPPNGMVPDDLTAIRVAEAILIPIYGKDLIDGEKPFRAKLVNSVWIVSGTLPPGHLGGVATVHIKKATAEVVFLEHGQ